MTKRRQWHATSSLDGIGWPRTGRRASSSMCGSGDAIATAEARSTMQNYFTVIMIPFFDHYTILRVWPVAPRTARRPASDSQTVSHQITPNHRMRHIMLADT